MQTEQMVDPFKIVRLLRAIRPQFIDQVRLERSSSMERHLSLVFS